MLLYDYPKAPNPMRVNLFINEKNITPKRIYVDLSKHDNLKPKFLKLNPWGTVPFIIVNKQVISESIAICKYLENKFPAHNLMGKTALEKAKIEMMRRKVEFDGLQAVGEAFRNSVKAFKGRAIAGPVSIPQISDLVKRGRLRTELFFDFLNKILGKNKFIAGNRFTVADIDAYVVLSFSKWIKIDGTHKRKHIDNWAKKLEKRSSFKKYYNLLNNN